MTIKFLNNGDSAEFFLDGRLDSMTSADAEKLLCETVEKNDFAKVVIDLEHIEYVSSAGLRVFMKLYMILKKNGGELIARNVPENIMDVFEMTGFVSLFRIE